MKSSVPLIAPLLRSDVQGRLLAELLLSPERSSSITDLATRVHTSAPTIVREVDRLVAAGFLLEERHSRSRWIRANRSHPLYAPVRQIVDYAYGPGVVLPRLLRALPGVEQAFVYGSWAARMSGIVGPDPADVDLLVVGRPDRAALFDAVEEAERSLGREVNVQTVSTSRWESTDDPFIQTVRSRPLIALDLHAAEAA